MKLVVIGASGLLGWNLHHVAVQLGHQVTGTYHRFALPGLRELSLERERELKELIRAEAPDAVVCCAAWSWVDGCEQDPGRAFRENGEQPGTAARLAREARSRFVYLSTSYVFNGRDGPYDETSPPNPLSVYGQAKRAGEVAVMKATEDEALIIRTMGLYGFEPQEKNFVYQVRRTLESGRRMPVPSDQFGNATDASNVAEGLLRLLEGQVTGTWNLAGPDPELSRSDFAMQIARSYQLDESLIVPTPTERLGQLAPRPPQGGLLVGKATSQLSWQPIPWRKF